MKVLIVTKDAKSTGGVANYFRLFFHKFYNPNIAVGRFDIGSRAIDYDQRQKRKLGYLVEFLRDLRRLILLLWKDQAIKIIHVNPSLIPLPLIRDGIILLIAKLLQRKTLVFFRGWSDYVAHKLRTDYFLRVVFLFVYKHADRVLVLANSFADDLKQLGFETKKISLTRTMFDGDLIQPKLKKENNALKFMFLSRISLEKGTFEIVKALGKLKNNGLNVHVNFFGHGATLTVVEELKNVAREFNVGDQCHFHGYIDGAKKYQAYSTHDVFLLPSHHEGCPNSVLEAMASGCFIISTGVGALSEVVEDRVNGLTVNCQDISDLAEKMEWAVINKAFVREAGMRNQTYAFKHFTSDKIINQIQKIYSDLI